MPVIMVRWQQCLRSLVSKSTKRYDVVRNSSFRAFNYSKAWVLPGEVSSLQNSFSSSVSRPRPQCLKKLELPSSRRVFSVTSTAYFPSIRVLPSKTGGNETQETTYRLSTVPSISRGIKQDTARGFYSRNPSSTLIRENLVVLGKSGNFCSQSKSADKFRCWNCSAKADNSTPFLFCQGCCCIQPVNDSIDFFQIFGLERTYKVKVEELETKYKNWQKKLHPDLVHSKSQREREYAAEQSARVIDAYRALTDPLLRAMYMVKLQGIVVDEEERITDPELLAEIMELREAVEEAEGPQALKDIQSQIWEKLQQCSVSFEDAFVNKKYEDAVASIQRMTYYRRANEEIIKKL